MMSNAEMDTPSLLRMAAGCAEEREQYAPADANPRSVVTDDRRLHDFMRGFQNGALRLYNIAAVKYIKE